MRLDPRLSWALAVLAMAVSLRGWVADCFAPMDGVSHSKAAEYLVDVVRPESGPRLVAVSGPPTGKQLADLVGCKTLSGRRFLSETDRLIVFSEDSYRQEPLSGPARLAGGQKIDLNTASARDLAILPRIGRQTAARMVNVRSRKGEYISIQDLTLVSGLGEKSVNRLAPWITVSPHVGP
ncbi:MAG: helix-hairpin-helix domain-containing protein [Deltaproteobacteria bacterium]|nr:helix-hairpin-helix domain-containing protein [Deltaproteobacteria bacterium]